MNKIVKSTFKDGSVKVLCQFEDGSECQVTQWLEKSKGKEWYTLPKNNPSHRQYLSKTLVDKSIDENGVFEFDTKTSEPRTLGNWKERLTPEELEELEKCQNRVDELKQIGLNRKPKDPKQVEIERLQKLVDELTKKVNGQK